MWLNISNTARKLKNLQLCILKQGSYQSYQNVLAVTTIRHTKSIFLGWFWQNEKRFQALTRLSKPSKYKVKIMLKTCGQGTKYIKAGWAEKDEKIYNSNFLNSKTFQKS